MDTRDVIARFDAERQALAVMDHPGVAKVFDAGATRTGRPYFVMEYIRGEPVTAYCDRARLGIRARLELFAAVCDAVQHAHTKGLIHRDLKPSNVLVTDATGSALPQPKVIDFGVAKAVGARLTDHTLHTHRGQVIGTPEYMSPEQADGGAGGDVDTRADVYSLGVVLYELVTGLLPFDARELRDGGFAHVARTLREIDPPRPSARLARASEPEASRVARDRGTTRDALVTRLRRELEWVPLRAMRKARGERYRSAAELADDVRNYLAGRPLVAGPESRAYRARKFLARHKAGVAASAAVVFLLVAGVVGTSWQAVAARRAQRQAESAEQVARAVNRFLMVDLLGAAQPERMQGGGQVTVLDAMRAALARADAGTLRDQPMVEAGVRLMIGRSLASLGNYDEAEPVLRRALRLVREHNPGSRESLANCLNDLAMVVQSRGDAAGAEPLLREALDLHRRALGDGHALVAASADNLAAALRQQGKLDEAEALYRRALEIRRRTLPAAHEDLAYSYNNLGTLLRDRGKAMEAEQLHREAVSILRNALPPGHPTLARGLINLAIAQRDQSRLADAERSMREALNLSRRALPPDHPDLAVALATLASILRARDKLAEAEPLYREALNIRLAKFGPAHESAARTAASLADVLVRLNRPDEAADVRASTRPASTRPAPTTR
jgi:serine/threonine protein kinase